MRLLRCAGVWIIISLTLNTWFKAYSLKKGIIGELFEVSKWLETGFSQISSCKQKSASDKKLLYFIDAKELSTLLGFLGSRAS